MAGSLAMATFAELAMYEFTATAQTVYKRKIPSVWPVTDQEQSSKRPKPHMQVRNF